VNVTTDDGRLAADGLTFFAPEPSALADLKSATGGVVPVHGFDAALDVQAELHEAPVVILTREGDEDDYASEIVRQIVAEAGARPRVVRLPGWTPEVGLADYLYEQLGDGAPPGEVVAALVAAPSTVPTAGATTVTVAPATDAPEPWPPLRLGDLPESREFPVDVFPDPVAAMVEEVASSVGCAPDIPALQALVVAAGTIGRSASLLLKPGYYARASLYGSIVGVVSDGKSPSFEHMRAPINAIDRRLAERYEADLAAWEATAEAEGSKRCKPAGTPPRPRRVDVADCTFEKLAEVIADNPRGLIGVYDELAVLLGGMNQYKHGGNDRAHLLSFWSGASTKIDRKLLGAPPLRLSYPSLSILGGIQPARFDALGLQAGDGLVERFLFAYPDPRPRPHCSETGVREPVAVRWALIVEALWRRDLDVRDGLAVPHVLRLTDEARAAWVRHYNAHIDELNAADFPDHLRGAWVKLTEHGGRLALVLTLLWDAAAEAFGRDPDPAPPVGRERVEASWRLVPYFKSSARRVHHVATGGGLDPDARGAGLAAAAPACRVPRRRGRRARARLHRPGPGAGSGAGSAGAARGDPTQDAARAVGAPPAARPAALGLVRDVPGTAPARFGEFAEFGTRACRRVAGAIPRNLRIS
jgi:hypothetical protein